VIVDGAERNTAAGSPLGFPVTIQLMSKRSSAVQLEASMGGLTSRVDTTLSAVARVSTLDHMRAWTNLANKASIILAKWTGFATVASVGSTATFTIDSQLDPFSTWGVVVGDRIAMPRQYVQQGAYPPSNMQPLTDEGGLYQVTAVEDYKLTATHLSGPLVLSNSTRNFDVGLPEAIASVEQFDAVQVYTTPNDGGYEVSNIDLYSPFRVYTSTLLSQNQSSADPVPMELEVTVGPASLSFASADLTVASSIAITGSARSLFFAAVPSAYGRSIYVQLPDPSPKIEKGDRLTFQETTGAPYTLTVKNVEARILTLDGSVPSNVVFEAGAAVPPKVTLISGKKKDMDVVVANLEDWAEQPPTDPAVYASSVNAALNPLLANNVPALGKVEEAKSLITTLRDKLVALSERLTEFDMDPVPAVDDLINTLKAKGADRGIDLLLQGRFSEFFGLDMDDMSYSGAMMKAARDVARNDLAQSRFGPARIKRKVLSTYEDSDPDYDHTDSEDLSSPPDASAGLDLPSAPDPV